MPAPGRATAFVGAIGDDHLGTIAQEFARSESLPCRWQIRNDQPTAASSIVINAQGENQIAVSFAANEHLDPAFVRAQEDLFRSARVLLLQLENNLDAVDAALDSGERHRLLRVLNTAPAHPDLNADLPSAGQVLVLRERLRDRAEMIVPDSANEQR